MAVFISYQPNLPYTHTPKLPYHRKRPDEASAMQSKRHPMKYFDLLLLLLWLTGVGLAVQRPSTSEAPAGISAEILSNDPALHRTGGLLYHGEVPFSGRLVEQYDDGAIKRLTPYNAGKAHGLAQAWYPDGGVMDERLYEAGRKAGVHTGWWENGHLKFIYHFNNDLHEGNAKSWYPDGTLYRDFNYENGKEAGTQRMWNEDGTVKANYVIKDGRRFGLIGSKPCS